MLNFLSNLLTKTVGGIHWPFCFKRFKLSDYPMISEKIKNEPFIPILVTTYGSAGSNFLIRAAQFFKARYWTKKTHVLISIGGDKVVEANGTHGIQAVSLLEAIGQRDEVMIMQPKSGKFVNLMAREYIIKLMQRDEKDPVKYDNNHDLRDSSEFDCSEVFFKAQNYGFQQMGGKLIEPIIRFGRESYSPADIERCDNLTIVYDSTRGGFQ